MIITYSEFLEECRHLNISGLQISYFIKNQLQNFPPHFRGKNGFDYYIFDETDLKNLQYILKYEIDKVPEQIIRRKEKEDAFSNLESQSPGLSRRLIDLLEREQLVVEEKIKIPNRNAFRFLKDQAWKKQSKWHNKIADYFRSLVSLGITLDGSEQLNFIARIAVKQAILQSEITSFFFDKVKPINTSIAVQKCLEIYVTNNKKMGWEDLSSDLRTYELLQDTESKLKSWTVSQSFKFIEELENQYNIVQSQVRQYLDKMDPEGHFIKFIAQRLIEPDYLELMDKIQQKYKNRTGKILPILKKLFEEGIKILTTK